MSSTCIWPKLFIRCSDLHTCYTSRRQALIPCLAKCSYLHATVGPLTTKDTLASFFHSTAPLHPPPSYVCLSTPRFFFVCFVESQEALLFSDARERFIKQKTISETDFHLPLPVCSSSPLAFSSLHLLSVSVSACVQTQHSAQRPAVTSDSFTLRPLSTLAREVLCFQTVPSVAHADSHPL